MKRALLVLVPAIGTGCVDTVEVTLRVQVAESLDGVVDLGGDALNLTVVPTGESGHDIEEPFVLPARGVPRYGFELVDIGSGQVVLGVGRTVVDTPVLQPESDDRAFAAALQPTLLLAPHSEVGLLQGLPPAQGNGGCVTADERGRVFVVGGSEFNQTGYGVDDEFRVTGLADGSLGGAEDVGCSALGGSVVATACNGAINISSIVDTGTDDSTIIPVAALCGSFAAKSQNDYWVISPDRVQLIDNEGGVSADVEFVFAAAIASVEATLDGDALVRLEDSSVWLITPEAPQPKQLETGIAALGRRFDDVVALGADGRLFLFDDGDLAVAQTTSLTNASAVTVLSDDTVAVIRGGALEFSNGAGPFALDVPRTRLAAIPGDTVVLAGGGVGVDVLALAGHTPKL